MIKEIYNAHYRHNLYECSVAGISSNSRLLAIGLMGKAIKKNYY